MDFQLQFLYSEDRLLVFQLVHQVTSLNRNLLVLKTLWFSIMGLWVDWNQIADIHLGHSFFKYPLYRKDTFCFSHRVFSKLNNNLTTYVDLLETLPWAWVAIWMIFLRQPTKGLSDILLACANWQFWMVMWVHSAS